MKKGTVKFFNHTKNFGFVKDDDGDTEYFFHGSGVEGTLPRDDDKVEFETEDSDKGPRATNVKVIEPEDDGKPSFGRTELNDASVQLR